MLFILLMIAVVPLLLRIGKGGEPQPVIITELDAGPGRVVRITVDTNSQGTLSLFYNVIENETVSIDRAFFGTLPRTSPPPEFVTYTAQEGDIVGFAQASAPKQIVILHDFKSGDSFPMRNVTYKPTDTNKSYPYFEEEGPILERGDRLFEKLNAEHPEDDFTLLRTMGLRPLTMPTGWEEDSAEGDS